MAKKTKETTPFAPPTREEIMLIQPNNVTFGQYVISETQENILTLISDKLQKHMTREEDLPLDMFLQPYVTIPCDPAGGVRHKSRVLAEAEDLTRKTFSFRWVHPTTHRTIKTTGVVITTIHDEQGSNNVTLNINPWAIPFLIYYGVGVGGTRYSKSIALTLRGNYTKRIYKILCSQRDRSDYYYPIEQFRSDLCIPAVYSNSQIAQKILDPAKDRIKESGSDVWFDYELICRHPVKGRKKKSDTIVLHIKTLHPREVGGEHYEQYKYVYRWISNAMGHPTDNRPQVMADHLCDTGMLKQIYDRCIYYDDEIARGSRTSKHAYNALLKILREDCGMRPDGTIMGQPRSGQPAPTAPDPDPAAPPRQPAAETAPDLTPEEAREMVRRALHGDE